MAMQSDSNDVDAIRAIVRGRSLTISWARERLHPETRAFCRPKFLENPAL
jgi:hypothetical protein